MSNRLTYGMILAAVFIVFSSTLCYAVTDPVVNIVDYANGLVKEAGSVQEEYANIANNFVQGKIGELGDFNALKKKAQKAQKLKERYEKAQKRYEQAKALAEKAKEKKDALMKKANKLKEKADKIKEKYDEAKEEIEKAKDKIDDVKDKVNDVKDKIDDVKDKVNDVQDKIDDVKGEIEGGSEEPSVTVPTERTTYVAPQTIRQEESETSTFVPNTSATTGGVTLPTSPRITASAIENLTTMDDAIVTDISLPSVPTAAEMTTPLSLEDVLQSQEAINQTEELPVMESEFSLEEQLLQEGKTDELRSINEPQKTSTVIKSIEQEKQVESKRQIFSILEDEEKEKTND